jgi:ABC-type lipoprotein export system ATPase subunit
MCRALRRAVSFDMSVFDNVAMGRYDGDGEDVGKEVTRVVDACRAALIHEFVRDLLEEYEMRLGNGGANLSGGQKQRLAIARAKLRNPTVLSQSEDAGHNLGDDRYEGVEEPPSDYLRRVSPMYVLSFKFKFIHSMFYFRRT